MSSTLRSASEPVAEQGSLARDGRDDTRSREPVEMTSAADELGLQRAQRRSILDADRNNEGCRNTSPGTCQRTASERHGLVTLQQRELRSKHCETVRTKLPLALRRLVSFLEEWRGGIRTLNGASSSMKLLHPKAAVIDPRVPP